MAFIRSPLYSDVLPVTGRQSPIVKIPIAWSYQGGFSPPPPPTGVHPTYFIYGF